MARKDYVGHSPKPKKKKAAKRPPAPKKRPVLAMLIFLCLAVGLGYFLAQISGTAEQTQPAPVKVKPKKLTVKEPLPEKPKEVWQYPQDLKEKEVIVEIPKQQDSDIRYQMQCGSFRQQAQAESMKATIAFQGLSAKIRHTGNWYRVVLGPYERKRTAEKDRHQIKRAGITTCEIWHWKP